MINASPDVLLIVIATFFVAGTVKGVIGFGLPTICLAWITVALDLPSAMALLLVPSFATNLWQALAGGNATLVVRRLWPFFLFATAAVSIGSVVLPSIDISYLSALLGGLLICYGIVGLRGVKLRIPAHRETLAGVVLGAVNGALTGLTGSFIVPGVMYMQALGLGREALLQAMGMLFFLSTAALALMLHSVGLLSVDLGVMSAAGLIPALVGMRLGQAIGQRLAEALFRRVFYVSLAFLGGTILWGAVFA